MVEKDRARFLDKQLIIVTLVISLIGLMSVYSASLPVNHILFYKQILWTLIGLSMMFGIILLPRKFLYSFSYWVYIVSVILCILPLIFDHSMEAKRWIGFSFFRFQPSELAKLGLIMALAVLLSVRKGIISKPNELIIPFLITFIPFILVLVEPDLGTSLVFPALLFSMLLIKGVKLKLMLFIFIPVISFLTAFHWLSWFIFIVVLVIFLFIYKRGFVYSFGLFILCSFIGTATPVFWNYLKPYQKERIIAFINPAGDPTGAGWHMLQSKIAIGSGGLFGKGFLHGTQNKLFFLPEQHTDFIFSVLGEEWGFLGGIIILALFLLLIARLIIIMRSTRSEWGILLLAGIVGYFVFQIFLNIGMCINILPVAGIPLPLISYGGSQTILSFIIIGIALNIGYNRYEY